MKKIVSFTVGWDTTAKKGYLNAVDEDQKPYAFGDLAHDEFQLMHGLLKEGKVFIDNNKWIISGWDHKE